MFSPGDVVVLDFPGVTGVKRRHQRGTSFSASQDGVKGTVSRGSVAGQGDVAPGQADAEPGDPREHRAASSFLQQRVDASSR